MSNQYAADVFDDIGEALNSLTELWGPADHPTPRSLHQGAHMDVHSLVFVSVHMLDILRYVSV